MQQVQGSSQKSAQGPTPQKVGYHGKTELIKETNKLAGIQQVLRVVCSTRDIAQVDAGEGVGGPGIAAHGYGLGHRFGHFDQIQGEQRRSVFVLGTEGAAVPVIGNALVARLPC